QVHDLDLDLTDIGADAEVDIIAPGTPLAELHRLSMAAIEPLAVEAGALAPDKAAAILERPTQPDFLSCGFVHIGVWGRRPRASRPRSLRRAGEGETMDDSGTDSCEPPSTSRTAAAGCDTRRAARAGRRARRRLWPSCVVQVEPASNPQAFARAVR